jgi:hypothetical protein
MSFQTDHLLEGRHCGERRCFEDTRAPSNCNEFVFRRAAAKRGDSANTAHFMHLSPQRLESPRAFPERGRIQISGDLPASAIVSSDFESPRLAMAVNRYFSGGFRAQISNQCACHRRSE